MTINQYDGWRYVIGRNWTDVGDGERKTELVDQETEHMSEKARSTTLCGIELEKLGDTFSSSSRPCRGRKRCAKCMEAYKVHPLSDYAKWMQGIAAITQPRKL